METTSEDIWQILAESERQISRFGAKFGGFTEGLALPSMEAVLRDQFGINVICPSVRICRNGEEQMRIDVLAYANAPINAAYIVDVKNHPVEDSITRLKSILQRFRFFCPEHQNKQLYGILAAVDMSPELREKTLEEGFYVARIHDEVFELDTPENFQPQGY
jgi:hypothetical protein